MDKTTLPKHVGIIMDGNRRWAKQQGLSFSKGYEAGFQALRGLLKHIKRLELEYLSVYAFSTENWQREKTQVDWLMNFISRSLKKEINEINDNDIRLRFIGSRENINPGLIKQLQDAERLTEKNRSGTLAVCFNYGGQQEIVDALKSIMASGVAMEKINTELVEQNLYSSDIPPLDLIIRTSGEHRISNFMLWRAAYSELYFIDKHWPDFTADDLDGALDEYARRQRRMGT
jgi:undecaprenyl diphosphate synthase